MENSKHVSIAIVTGHKLSKNDDFLEVNQTLYKSMIGKINILYIALNKTAACKKKFPSVESLWRISKETKIGFCLWAFVESFFSLQLSFLKYFLPCELVKLWLPSITLHKGTLFLKRPFMKLK